MNILVVAFASASEALAATELTVQLPADARVSDLKTTLTDSYPSLEELWPRLAVAVDGELTREDLALHDGAEVALLPPVSGGQGDSAVSVSDDPIDTAALVQWVSDPSRGAVTLFLGTVRNHHAGQAVQSLTYSAYQGMAEKVLQRIVNELEGSSADSRIAIHHRTGQLSPGTASVGIAVAAPHRETAYDLNRRALERLKQEVPVWKLEHYVDGQSRWREEESLVQQGRATP